MKKLFVFVLMSLLLVSMATAKLNNNQNNDNDCSHRWFCNNGFNSECQNFFNNPRYFTIEQWTYNNVTHGYEIKEKNGIYSRFNIEVNETLRGADWHSNMNIHSILVESEHGREAFNGSLSGFINSTQHNISHITFCGYNNGNNGGSIGNNGGSNGVPEFPAFTVGAAVLVVTLGLIFLRKN